MSEVSKRCHEPEPGGVSVIPLLKGMTLTPSHQQGDGNAASQNLLGEGGKGIKTLERELNAWVTTLCENGGVVIDRQTAMCTIADDPRGDSYQCLAITVWYEVSTA